MVARSSRAPILKRFWPAMSAPKRRARRQRPISAPFASGYSAPRTLSLFTTYAATLRSRATSARLRSATHQSDRRPGPLVAFTITSRYDTIGHPALGQSPREAFLAGVESAGHQPNRVIAYDQAFL